MRKSRHFIKNLVKKINIYVVVFVALVNAFFYCPEVQAAVDSSDYSIRVYEGVETSGTPVISIDSPSLTGGYAYNKSPSSGTYSPTLAFSIDSPDFLSGNYFEFEFEVYFNINMTGSVSGTNDYDGFFVMRPVYGTRIPDSTFNGYYYPSDSTFVKRFYGSTDNLGYSIGSPYISLSFSGCESTSTATGYTVILSYCLSGSYDYTDGISFVFEPGVHLDGSNYGWLMLGINFERLTISGASTSDSENLQQLVDGYNDSAGSQAASDLDNSASGYESAEDSIFTSSKFSLDGFEFFDFNSIPAVVTGLSFITTTATAIFDAMGGTSGAGIVLSVLFAVMFVSIVIGLYRYFK